MKRPSDGKWAVAGILLAGMGAAFYMGTNSNSAPEEPGEIMSIQCIDPAAQETIFSQDYIVSAEQDYDLYVLQLKDSKVMYVQPSGVICTLQVSVMALENANGKVD